MFVYYIVWLKKGVKKKIYKTISSFFNAQKKIFDLITRDTADETFLGLTLIEVVQVKIIMLNVIYGKTIFFSKREAE